MVLWSNLKEHSHSPSTCLLVLRHSSPSPHSLCLIHAPVDMVTLPNQALTPTQLTCRPKGFAFLPSLVCPQAISHTQQWDKRHSKGITTAPLLGMLPIMNLSGSSWWELRPILAWLTSPWLSPARVTACFCLCPAYALFQLMLVGVAAWPNTVSPQSWPQCELAIVSGQHEMFFILSWFSHLYKNFIL